MIFVNFKTYEAGTGEKAMELAGICRKVAQETAVEIIPLVQTADIYRLAQAGFTVWAQHADAVEYGAHTGWVLPEAEVEAGAAGVMLNHAERRLAPEMTEETIKRIRAIKQLVKVPQEDEVSRVPRGETDNIARDTRLPAGRQGRQGGTLDSRDTFVFRQNSPDVLRVLVCTQSVEEAKRVEKLTPDFIAYEPPEFIGSRTTSVSQARPEVVKEFVNQVHLSVLIGAGIHSGQDVRIALELGARGILVATDVVLAEKPEERLRELARAFKNRN